MKATLEEVVEMLKETYPVGTRVRLEYMNDKQAPPVGTCGTVNHIDSIGTIHINWDTGSHLGLIHGVDKFSIISKPVIDS